MKALVTGGGGFLGGAIVRMLRERGDAVRSYARGQYHSLASLGVDVVRGDLADREAVIRACAGVDVVFHVAGKAGIAGPHAEYVSTNVVGTRNVIEGCRAGAVTRLVFTSSPSVIFDGRDLEGVDESVPYPKSYHASYPETKAEAERIVLAANGPMLATVALRPHLIWGPGDNNLIPRLLTRARSGALRRIGEDKRVDGTYIDNAASAHLLAADRLARPTAGRAGAHIDPGTAVPGPCSSAFGRLAVAAPIAGKAYFIAQGEPLGVWELINKILDAAGEPPITRSIPPAVAHAVGAVLEFVHRAFNLDGEPRMTRFLAGELTTAHWFDLTAARRDLGYEASVSTEEGLKRLKRWFVERGEYRSPLSGCP